LSKKLGKKRNNVYSLPDEVYSELDNFTNNQNSLIWANESVHAYYAILAFISNKITYYKAYRKSKGDTNRMYNDWEMVEQYDTRGNFISSKFDTIESVIRQFLRYDKKLKFNQKYICVKSKKKS
jgi:hypothetical protein